MGVQRALRASAHEQRLASWRQTNQHRPTLRARVAAVAALVGLSVAVSAVAAMAGAAWVLGLWWWAAGLFALSVVLFTASAGGRE